MQPRGSRPTCSPRPEPPHCRWDWLSIPPDPLLYVGLVTINHIAVYTFTDSGRLNFLQAVPDAGHGVCWLTINKAATRLYASNTGDPSVGVFDISKDPKTPIQIQNVAPQETGGGGGFEFRLDSTNQWLHVITQQSSATATAWPTPCTRSAWPPTAL